MTSLGAGGSGGGTGGSAVQDSGGGTGGGATGGGGAGAGTGGSGGTTATNLGKACATSADCGSGLNCISAGNSTRGPGGGYCTKSCSQNTDCQALDPNARCVNWGSLANPVRYCLEGCAQGGSSVYSNKCHGRITDGQGPVACAQLFQGNADGGIVDSGAPIYACQPICGSDADCGSKKCDLSTGFCSTAPKTGDPIGTPCNPQAIQGGAADPAPASALVTIPMTKPRAFAQRSAPGAASAAATARGKP